MGRPLIDAAHRLAAVPECAPFRASLEAFALNAAQVEDDEVAIAAAPAAVRVLVHAWLGGYFDRPETCTPRLMVSSNDTVLSEVHHRLQREASKTPAVAEIVAMARSAEASAEAQQ